MGWELDESDAVDGQFHEGYVIGVERVTETAPSGFVVTTRRWREVGADFDHASDDPSQRARRNVDYVQVACDCGWRSERMFAPLGTYWAPCCTELPATFDFEKAADDVVWSMWKSHVDGLGPHSLSERGRMLLALRSAAVS